MFTMFTRKSNQTNMTSPIWGRFPVWLIFFKWVETTNQFTNFCRRSRPLSPYLKTSRNGAVGRWSAWCAMCGEKWEPFLEVWLKGWPGDVCVCVFLVWCCHVMLCYDMLCYVMLWYVMLMLCFVMLCYVMLCYVMLCVFWLYFLHLVRFIIDYYYDDHYTYTSPSWKFSLGPCLVMSLVFFGCFRPKTAKFTCDVGLDI